MNDCTVYADSLMSANAESGDVILSGAKVYAEIGQVIVGQKEAKKNQRTIFKSLGIYNYYNQYIFVAVQFSIFYWMCTKMFANW